MSAMSTNRPGPLNEQLPVIQAPSRDNGTWGVEAKLKQAKRCVMGAQLLLENAQATITTHNHPGELYLSVLTADAQRLQEAIGYLLESRYDGYSEPNNPRLKIF